MAYVKKRGESYQITVSCGYNKEGKQITKSLTWRPDAKMKAKDVKHELSKKTIEFEELIQNGGTELNGFIRFDEFCQIWMEEYSKKQLKATTYSRYQGLLKRILPALGHLRLNQIQPHQLIAFENNLREVGVKDSAKCHCKIDFKQ